MIRNKKFEMIILGVDGLRVWVLNGILFIGFVSIIKYKIIFEEILRV